MSSHRPGRVGDVIRETLAEVVRREITDPRVGFVTFTEVRMAQDLRTATVFTGVIGDDDARRGAIDALNHAAPYLQRAIGRKVRLRYTPQLRFVFDEAGERGQRIEALLDDLGPELAEAPDEESE